MTSQEDNVPVGIVQKEFNLTRSPSRTSNMVHVSCSISSTSSFFPLWTADFYIKSSHFMKVEKKIGDIFLSSCVIVNKFF